MVKVQFYGTVLRLGFRLIFIICFKFEVSVYVLILTIKFMGYVYGFILWYNVTF